METPSKPLSANKRLREWSRLVLKKKRKFSHTFAELVDESKSVGPNLSEERWRSLLGSHPMPQDEIPIRRLLQELSVLDLSESTDDLDSNLRASCTLITRACSGWCALARSGRKLFVKKLGAPDAIIDPLARELLTELLRLRTIESDGLFHPWDPHPIQHTFNIFKHALAESCAFHQQTEIYWGISLNQGQDSLLNSAVSESPLSSAYSELLVAAAQNKVHLNALLRHRSDLRVTHRIKSVDEPPARIAQCACALARLAINQPQLAEFYAKEGLSPLLAFARAGHVWPPHPQISFHSGKLRERSLPSALAELFASALVYNSTKPEETYLAAGFFAQTCAHHKVDFLPSEAHSLLDPAALNYVYGSAHTPWHDVPKYFATILLTAQEQSELEGITNPIPTEVDPPRNRSL